MKVLLVLLALVGAYLYFMLHTTNIVLGQLQQLNHTYQYTADRAAKIVSQ